MSAKGRARLVALAAVAIAAAAPAPRAETKVIASSGSWVAFGGTTEVGNKAWRIDNGAKLKVPMNFDGNATWNATATGFHFNDGDPGLEFTVNVNEKNQFLTEFRNRLNCACGSRAR
jgi:hypothetical protein